jgi:hypothetical protein
LVTYCNPSAVKRHDPTPTSAMVRMPAGWR